MKRPGTQTIRTARLTLRKFTMEDVPSVYTNYGSDPKVNTYISFAPCTTPESTEGFLRMHVDRYAQDPSFYGWAVQAGDDVIGSIGIFNIDEDCEQGELGYSIGSRWWGNGYATEAAEAVLRYAFREIGLHRVYASHHIENTASGRVLMKIGMREEGILRDGQKNPDGTFSDLRLYAKLSTDD